MRILLVTHNVVRGDGQGRVNYELTRHCLARGHEVSLMADRVDPSLIESGARLVPVHPAINRPNVLKATQFARQADRLLSQGDLRRRHSLIVANGYVTTFPHDVNISHFVHGCWLRSPVHLSRIRHGPYGWYQHLYSRLNARWEQKAYGAARSIVAVSNQIRDELVEIGLPAGRIRVIHNGVDIDEFRPGTAGRAEFDLPEAVPLGVFVGDIRTPRKNLDGVLRALATVQGPHLAVVGAVAGSPFPKLADRLGVAGRVHFLDYRKDVARIMRACDFFVFPSRYEACSLALLEAMASGLPVVSATTAGGSELVSQDCGVILDDPDDIVSLARAIKDLAFDPERRRLQSLAARRVAEQHSWGQKADQYIALFEELAADSPVASTMGPA